MNFSPYQQRRRKRLSLIHWEDVKGKTVLDIGCNTGMFCFEALRRGAREATGLDRDADFVRVANKRARGMRGALFETVDLDKLDLLTLNGPYDVVFLLAMLKHVKDRARLVKMVDVITDEVLYFETNKIRPKSIFPLEAQLAVLKRNSKFENYECVGKEYEGDYYFMYRCAR